MPARISVHMSVRIPAYTPIHTVGPAIAIIDGIIAAQVVLAASDVHIVHVYVRYLFRPARQELFYLVRHMGLPMSIHMSTLLSVRMSTHMSAHLS